MKKIIFALSLILFSCSKKYEHKNLKGSRIQIVEHVSIDGNYFSIIKVDSVEYILGSNCISRHSK